MYWYDIKLMLNEYNEMLEESENNNSYKDDLAQQQANLSSNFSNMNPANIKLPSMPNIGSLSNGFKMPSL